MDIMKIDNEVLAKQISELLENARKYVATSVNTALIKTYWNIGKLISNDFEKHKNDEAYKNCSLRNLSLKLSRLYGKGYSKSSLQRIIIFYEYYKSVPTLSGQLSWSHYIELIQINSEHKRMFYQKECENARWSVRELRRQIESELFERVLSTRNTSKQKEILKLANNGIELTKPTDVLKNPFVLEFLDQPEEKPFYEKDLEKALKNEIEKFMLELGKGFMFVGTQQRVSVGNNHYYVDMVFYNKILRRYVLIELKNSKFVASAVGQINFYLNYYKNEINDEYDEDPIGIILCKDGVQPNAKYALEGINNNVFAANFTTIMPTQLELQERVNQVVKSIKK
ncbi:MAG: PDDEXK nuclease domain-containing protein [Clostridia bacterium]|nr:PDDEXK nuclease domain-containing protein [Clostridia bacterium]